MRGTTYPRLQTRRYGTAINFNPRAHEGHDVSLLLLFYSSNHFNPRAHEGHDMIPGFYMFHEYEISIHAPMRGTTFSKYITCLNVS